MNDWGNGASTRRSELPFSFVSSENWMKDHRFGPRLKEKALEEVGNTEPRSCHSPAASMSHKQEQESSLAAGEKQGDRRKGLGNLMGGRGLA